MTKEYSSPVTRCKDTVISVEATSIYHILHCNLHIFTNLIYTYICLYISTFHATNLIFIQKNDFLIYPVSIQAEVWAGNTKRERKRVR